MATFTPPVISDNPPILPDAPSMANRLFRYFPNRARYIAVFILSDGTVVQDTPNGTAPDGSTVSNTNTNIPYPIDPWNPASPFSTSYYIDYSKNPPVPTVSKVSQSPYVAHVLNGVVPITADQKTQLTNAGYGACIS